MPIRFACPHCNAAAEVSERLAGYSVRCAKCRKPISVPAVRSPQPAASEAATPVSFPEVTKSIPAPFPALTTPPDVPLSPAGLVRSRETRPATPDEASAPRPRVKRVTEGSLAALLGLSIGDRTLTIAGRPVQSAGQWGWVLGSCIDRPSATIEILHAADGTVITSEVPPIPIGVEVEDTVESLTAAVAADPEDLTSALRLLEKLFEERRYDRLEQVAREAHRRHPQSPALLFTGAAKIGQAARAGALERATLLSEGIRPLREYLQKYVSRWTTNFRAAALAAEGMYHEACSETDAAIEQYEAALEDLPEYAAAQEGLSRLTGQPVESFAPTESLWTPGPFPIDYVLDRHPNVPPRGPTSHSLRETARALAPGAFLGVIALGSYRCCGPCNTETLNLARIAKHLPSVVPVIHLITSSTDRLREGYEQAEEWLHKSGLRFHVLHDPADSVAAGLGISSVPYLCFVDREGTLVERGHELKDEMAWNLILGRRRGAANP